MVVGAALVVRARSILFAVASLGLVGYGLALLFLFFGGPDLALTQFAVETLTVILFVLVLRRLPPLRTVSSALDAGPGRGRGPGRAGPLMTGIVLATAAAYHPAPLREYFARASVPLAHGRNVVNVILVDFRALDTLGEITVLAVAALGVFALMRLRRGSARGGPVMIIRDSLILRTDDPSPLPADPRLLGLSPDPRAQRARRRLRGRSRRGGGLRPGPGVRRAGQGATGPALSTRSSSSAPGSRWRSLSGVPPLLDGGAFLTGHWLEAKIPVIGHLGTPLVFDVGVYLAVLGVVTTIIFELAEERAVTVVLAVVIGLLYAAGLYLVMRRSMVKLILGLALLGHAANLLIFTVGGLTRGGTPDRAAGQRGPAAALPRPGAPGPRPHRHRHRLRGAGLRPRPASSAPTRRRARTTSTRSGPRTRPHERPRRPAHPRARWPPPSRACSRGGAGACSGR